MNPRLRISTLVSVVALVFLLGLAVGPGYGQDEEPSNAGAAPVTTSSPGSTSGFTSGAHARVTTVPPPAGARTYGLVLKTDQGTIRHDDGAGVVASCVNYAMRSLVAEAEEFAVRRGLPSSDKDKVFVSGVQVQVSVFCPDPSTPGRVVVTVSGTVTAP